MVLLESSEFNDAMRQNTLPQGGAVFRLFPNKDLTDSTLIGEKA
jgi:hypothetical protein